MPKPTLTPEQSLLEDQIIETMIAGLKLWRPDLNYPESYSDMQACVRGLMIAFSIKRNPLPVSLKIVCDACEGLGHLVTEVDGHCRRLSTCPECKGRGHTLNQ